MSSCICLFTDTYRVDSSLPCCASLERAEEEHALMLNDLYQSTVPSLLARSNQWQQLGRLCETQRGSPEMFFLQRKTRRLLMERYALLPAPADYRLVAVSRDPLKVSVAWG